MTWERGLWTIDRMPRSTIGADDEDRSEYHRCRVPAPEGVFLPSEHGDQGCAEGPTRGQGEDHVGSGVGGV